MNIIQELRKEFPRYKFNLHDDGVVVTFHGGHKYVMTIDESKRLLDELKTCFSPAQNQRVR